MKRPPGPGGDLFPALGRVPTPAMHSTKRPSRDRDERVKGSALLYQTPIPDC